MFHSFFFFKDTATTEIYTLPYTTLFRSSDTVLTACAEPKSTCHHWLSVNDDDQRVVELPSTASPGANPERSDEHTSELQSPCNLVCRLLLANEEAACDAPDPVIAVSPTR